MAAAQHVDEYAGLAFSAIDDADFKLIRDSMVRAHAKDNVIAPNATEPRLRRLIRDVNNQATYAAAQTDGFLRYLEGLGLKEVAGKKQEYAASILELLKSPEIVTLSKRMRTKAATYDRSGRAQSVIDIKAKLSERLKERFPELAAPFYTLRPNYALYTSESVAELYVELLSFRLKLEKLLK